ncbi:hypothetical protein QTP88_021015 [Uroleucon formosanum]
MCTVVNNTVYATEYTLYVSERDGLTPECRNAGWSGRESYIRHHLTNLYHSAGCLHYWIAIRYCSSLLRHAVDSISPFITTVLVNGKQLTVGVVGQKETVFDKPMTPAAIHSIMYSTIQPFNVIQAVLQQEIILYCGRLIATNPDMFKGILKIRVGWVMEAMMLELNSGKKKQLLVENLSPYAIRKLLQKIFTVKEWGQIEQINMLQKRKLEGCLCRVPNRFYNQVWDILRRTPRGIRFRNQVMPQQPTINNMTHSELQFALYIESMLNQLEKPEYRQLIVELLCIVSTILIRNPELTLKELNLDSLVTEANKMFCKDNQMTLSDNLDAFISSKYSITAGYFARAVVNNILTGGQMETSAVDIDEDDDGNIDKCTVSYTESTVSTESLSIDMNPISKLATSTITTNETECIPDMEPNSISAESTLTSSSLAFFIRPASNESVEIKLAFLKSHPIQPLVLSNDKLPFDPQKMYYQTLSDFQKVQRKWLSYCSYSKRIFCTTCMTFCPLHENISNLITGLEVLNSKNVYGTIKKHEQSKTHGEAVSALLQANLNKNIESCININLREIHSKEVEFNRLIIKRLIDIIMFIGRQGLAFRGKDEEAYSLEDMTINHGKFLELVLLIKDYDVVLNMHVKYCIELSKKRKAGGKKKNNTLSQTHSRGSLVIFLSKTFINKIVLVIGNLLQEKIVNELKEAQSFSILVDSTQDVPVLDQLAVCVRYVLKNNVYEKLLKLVVAYDFSGIGCSFDGASNMKGVYNGLQSHLKENANLSCIYTHCLGHVLNLVMVDLSEFCKNAEFLFGLVQQSATFLLDSHKRMKEMTSSESKFDAKTKYTAHTLLQNCGLPENSLLKLSELTKTSVHVLTFELQQFAIQYDTITKNFNDTFSKNDLSFDNNSNSESELNIDHSLECNTCNNCLRYAFNILYEIVQQSGSFNNIYLAYQFVLTLPCTQITCERIFSKVKNIKTKLRSLISQDIMEALLMINIERDYVVDKEIVNTIAKSLTELSSRGILSLGTVRTNRLPNCKLNDSKMQRKLLREKSIEYISSYKNTPISAITWKDNKPVTLLSTYAGKLPETKMVREEQNLPVQFEVADWRKKIAYSLTKSGDFKNQRGRRSISIETKRASTRASAMHPTCAVRTDGVGHSQIRADKRGRCKFPKCNGYTWIQCSEPESFPNDPGKFPDYKSNEMLSYIMQYGPCQPSPWELPSKFFPKTVDSSERLRCLHQSYYKSVTNNSKVNRIWLFYSPSFDKVFCVLCKMFDLTKAKNCFLLMKTSENSIIPITPRRGRKKIALPSEWQRQKEKRQSHPQCEHKNKNQQQYQYRTLTMQDEKGLCKRDNLLKKNFGCNWKNLADLEYFKTVMDDEENNEQDHESDFEDINEEEEEFS